MGATEEEITVSNYAEKEDNIVCQVRVFDNTNRSSGWTDSNTIYVNNSEPIIPVIVLPIEDIYYKNMIRFNWTDSTDADDEPMNYWINVLNSEGEDIANISWASSNWNKNISDLDIWPAGNYNMSVGACDNEICSYSPVVNFGVDYIVPFVNISTPINDSIYGMYFDLNVNMTDNLSGIYEHWYNLTNSSGDVVRSGLLVLSGTDNYYAQVLTSGLSSEEYTITAYATDNVNNINSSSRDIWLDLDAAKLVVDPDNWVFREQWLKDDLDITIEINRSGTIYSSEEDVIIKNITEIDYTIRFNDGTLKIINSTSTNSTEYSWDQSFDTTGWVEGRYDVVVNVEDYWNNTNTITTWFMIDRSAPSYANMGYEPLTVYDKDDINLSIDLINNVFIWESNENNIDKDLTVFQYNNTVGGTLVELNVSSGNISYVGDNFYGMISNEYAVAGDTLQWRVNASDLAGNLLVTPWQYIIIASTPPTFDSNIADLSWEEDEDDTSLDLDDYFSDEDQDTLTYTVDILPKGTLLYDNFDNLSDTMVKNNGTYENVVLGDGLNDDSLLIQSEVNNLLINGDFEEQEFDEEYINVPVGWERNSYPRYNHTGPPGVENYTIVNEHNYYSQAVAVEEEETYTLSMYVINDSEPGYGRMHINWFNSLYLTDTSVNKTLSYLSSTLDCEDPYNCTGIYYLNTTADLNSSASRRSLILDSPSNAVYAEIVLDTDSLDISARINDVQFEQKDYSSEFYSGHRLPGVLFYPVETNRGRDRLNLEEGTVTMFVKPTWDSVYTNNEQETFFNVKSSNVDVLMLSAENEKLTFSLLDEAYQVEQNISGWEEGDWHFVAITWDNSSLMLNVDGVEENVSAVVSFGSINITDSDIYVGSDANGENQANSYIDEFAIFDYAKSSEELNEIDTNENSSYLEKPIAFSVSNGVVTLNPKDDYFGEQRAIFYGEDDYTKVYGNMVNLEVTPVNDAPRFNSSNSINDSSWWINQNQTIDLSEILYDVDGDLLIYELNFTGEYENISLESSGTIVTLIPDSDWAGRIENMSIIASDDDFSNSSNMFNVTVYFNWLNNTWVNGTFYHITTVNYDNSLTEIYQSSAQDSNFTELSGHTIVNSYFINSNISNSDITNSHVTNSTLEDIILVDTVVVGAFIDPSNVTNSTIIGNTRIIDSVVWNSVVDTSNITDSTIYNWVVEHANIDGNCIYWGNISNWDGTDLLYNKTDNGTCDNLPSLINYDPMITEFTTSIGGEGNNILNVGFNVKDINFNSVEWEENLTTTVNFGNGYIAQGYLDDSSDEGSESTTYSSSGTYTVILTVEDEGGAIDVEIRTITISLGDDDDDDEGGSSSSSSGGGSGGGRSASSNDEEDEEDEGINYVGQATSSIPNPSCTDGIKNQGEQGVDCGGPCSPCLVKATCFDNIRNQNEEEVDCGGVCGSCNVQEEDSTFSLFPYFIALLVAAIIIFVLATYLPKKKKSRRVLGAVGLSKGPITSSRVGIEQHPLPHHIAIQSAIHSEQGKDVFESLRQYINARLRSGTGKEHIKETLMMKGWPEEVVDVALDGSTELEGKLREVEDYIRDSFASGYKLKQIKLALIQRGWSKGIADLLLFEVHRPTRNLKNLREYVDYKIMQGKNLSEIKQILRSVGWRAEVIDSLLK